MVSEKIDKSSCLKQINNGIYSNNTRGEEGRKERDLECNDLLLKYFYNCDFSTPKPLAISLVFSDTTTTMVQAIESYRYGQFDASMVMIRNAIDASTYISIVYALNYDMIQNRILSISPIGSVIGYKKFKCWVKRKNEIVNRGFLRSDELNKLHEIRERGNFSAHYFEIRRDKFHEYIKGIAKLNKPKPDLPKQYTNEYDVKDALNTTLKILMELHENYLKYYEVPI